MAKKLTPVNEFSFEDIVSTMKTIIKPTAIQHVTEESSKQRGYISTGIYVLNAAFSGDIYGGIADNRITVFGGESSCLFPTEKINICIMKTKNKKHKVYDNSNESIRTINN